MKLPVIALATMGAALLFAAPAPAHAQLSVVQAQLDSAVVLLGNEGYRKQDDFVTGSMDAGEEEEFELTLEAGKRYSIVGFCDGDCTDLDMALTTAAGEDVSEDFAADDYPVVEVTPRRNGTYNLRVVMAVCSVEPCYYGVGVFARN
jgi:hypothetical protein